MGRLFDTNTNTLAAPNPMAKKLCPKCGQSKPLTLEFWPPRNDRRNGVRGVCRECTRVQRQTPEYKRRERLYQLRYYIANRSDRIAANRRYKLRNHEHWLEYARQWNKRRCVDVHIPDIESWQYHGDDSVAIAIEALQAQLPQQLSDAIDAALGGNFDEVEYEMVIEQVKQYLRKA